MKFLRTNFKKILAVLGMGCILMTTSGCSKKAECNIETYHAHRYVNDKKMVRYIDQEYVSYEGYTREDEYIALDEADKKLYRYLDDRNLLRIDDNIELIQADQAENQNFMEYRYSYSSVIFLPIRAGKTSIVVPFRRTRYNWTRDENHENLTGETRLCGYYYTSYKIEVDEYGKYVLIPCQDHEDIISHKDEFPYIKEDYYQVIDITNSQEASYEDVVEDTREENSKEGTSKVLKLEEKRA